MPIHREPLWVEVMIDDILTWLTELVSAPFRGTRLEWWALHPEGKTLTQTLSIALVVFIWYIMLDGSVWCVLCGLCSRLSGGYVGGEDAELLEDGDDMRRPASPGNRATDAVLGCCSSRAGNALAARPGTSHFAAQDAKTSENEASTHETSSSSSTPPASRTTHTIPHPAQNKPIHHGRAHLPSNPHGLGRRTGRPSSPGHQTPFKPYSTISILHQSSQSSQTCQKLLLGTRHTLTQNTGGYRRPAASQGITTPRACWRAGAMGTSSLGSRGLLAGIDGIGARVDDVMAEFGAGALAVEEMSKEAEGLESTADPASAAGDGGEMGEGGT